jgi:peptide deformylase
MVMPIYVYGQPVLRKKAVEIPADYPGLNELLENMWETMKSDGVGLAAPQIGKSIRLFIIDATPFAEDFPEADGFKKVFINPVILERKGENEKFNEGCLSLPGIREDIMRKNEIRIKYYDEKFKLHEQDFSGIKARIILHEYDHLEGKLFIDLLSPIKRRLLKARLDAIMIGKVEVKYKIKIPK